MDNLLRIMMLVSAFTFVTVLAGCPAGMTGAQKTDVAIAVGGDVLTCAGSDAANVRDAITHGGVDWLSVVVAAFHCIPQIVKDIEAAEAQAMLLDPMSYYVADAVTNIAPIPETRMSKGAKRRLAAAKVLGDVLNSKVKP